MVASNADMSEKAALLSLYRKNNKEYQVCYLPKEE
jgi:hypothetical protein